MRRPSRRQFTTKNADSEASIACLKEVALLPHVAHPLHWVVVWSDASEESRLLIDYALCTIAQTLVALFSLAQLCVKFLLVFFQRDELRGQLVCLTQLRAKFFSFVAERDDLCLQLSDLRAKLSLCRLSVGHQRSHLRLLARTRLGGRLEDRRKMHKIVVAFASTAPIDLCLYHDLC